MGTAVADVRVNLLFTERSLICSKLKTDLAESPWLQAQHSRQCRPPHGRGRLGKNHSPQPWTGSTGLNSTSLLKQSVTTGIIIKSKVRVVSGASSGKTGTLWRHFSRIISEDERACKSWKWMSHLDADLIVLGWFYLYLLKHHRLLGLPGY